MARKIVAVLLGIVLAVGIVAAAEALGHSVYPVPADMKWDDAVQMKSYVESLPIGAFLFVVGGWLLGTLCGGLLACFVAREKPYLYSAIVGGFVLAATVYNLVVIPHPLWFSATAVIGIIVTSYIAGLIASSGAFSDSMR